MGREGRAGEGFHPGRPQGLPESRENLHEMSKALAFAALVALGGLFHGLGHLLAGLAAGARVEEVSLGVGPRLAALGPLVLRGFPLWARVRWEGQEDEGPYQLLPPGRRLALTLGGPLGNLAGSLLLLVALGALYGRIQAGPLDHVVYGVVPGSPAEAAGLERGDRIAAVDGRPWTSLEDFQRAAEAAPATLTLDLERGADRLRRVVRLDPLSRIRRVGVKVRPPILLEALPPSEVLPYAWRMEGAMVLAPLRVGRWSSGLLRLPDGGVLVGPSGWGGLHAAGWLLGAATVNAWLALMFLLPLPGTDGMRALIQVAQLGGLAVPTAAEERLHGVGTWAFGTAYALILLVIASGD